MDLILLRHAKSSWQKPCASDWLRGLNSTGVKTLPKVVAQLRLWVTDIDLVVTSDACRAQQTAEAVASAFPHARYQTLPELYGADSGELKALITRYWADSETQVWVGHNPALQLLVQQWLGIATRKLPTASMVKVRFSRGGAIDSPLRLWTPKGGECQLV